MDGCRALTLIPNQVDKGVGKKHLVAAQQRLERSPDSGCTLPGFALLR